MISQNHASNDCLCLNYSFEAKSKSEIVFLHVSYKWCGKNSLHIVSPASSTCQLKCEHLKCDPLVHLNIGEEFFNEQQQYISFH